MNSADISSPKASEALGLWEPKRTLTLEAARKHSRRIKLLRLGLFTVAGAILAYLAYEFATQKTRILIKDDPTESVRMIAPRYSGRTDDGLPYYLTAKTATRTLANRNEVGLDVPLLEFIREEGSVPSYVKAETGVYDDMEKILDLETSVDLKTDDGYACQTLSGRIFAKEKRIAGNEHIACTGNFGTANGNSYEITDNYKTFVFKDGMDAVIEQDPNGSDSLAASIGSPRVFGGNAPIAVKAQTATYKGGLTVLVDDVDVSQGTARLRADKMEIYRAAVNDESTGSLKLGEVVRIVAIGNFHYTTPETTVKGDKGVYERAQDSITITGEVRVVQQSGNKANTDRLVYNVRTEAIRFAGDCAGGECSARPTVRIGNGN